MWHRSRRKRKRVQQSAAKPPRRAFLESSYQRSLRAGVLANRWMASSKEDTNRFVLFPKDSVQTSQKCAPRAIDGARSQQRTACRNFPRWGLVASSRSRSGGWGERRRRENRIEECSREWAHEWEAVEAAAAELARGWSKRCERQDSSREWNRETRERESERESVRRVVSVCCSVLLWAALGSLLFLDRKREGGARTNQMGSRLAWVGGTCKVEEGCSSQNLQAGCCRSSLAAAGPGSLVRGKVYLLPPYTYMYLWMYLYVWT